MSIPWRESLATRTLLAEINDIAPRRSKRSDGSIGDADHASRSSDHNPWIDDPASRLNVVSARDYTHDPGDGADMAKISEMLRKRAHDGHLPQAKYIIFNRRITSKNTGWLWIRYNGSNPHTAHMHVSVGSAKSQYDSTKTWGVSNMSPAPGIDYEPYQRGVKPGSRGLRKGKAGDDVKWLQQKLGIKADGYFGEGTEQAVEKFEKANGLLVNGVATDSVWRRLLPSTPPQPPAPAKPTFEPLTPEENDMGLVILRVPGQAPVWITNFLVRRWIQNQDELRVLRVLDLPEREVEVSFLDNIPTVGTLPQ